MATKQVILVTGASTGFGRLFTETLARNGHTVFATMRDPKGKNAKNAAEIEALAKQESLPIHVLDLDVTKDDSVDKAVRAVVDKAGRLDVVINNAGFVTAGLTETITTEQAQRQFDTNFFGALRMNRAALPQMKRQGNGLLLHVSSGAGRLAIPALGVYCASKFALEALAEVYRYELAALGIDSVVIEPGAYPTPIMVDFVPGEDSARRNGYGEVAGVPDKVGASLAGSKANSQDIADSVLRIIETPPGQRQLRYRVSGSDSTVARINSVTVEVQAQFIESFGLTATTTFKAH